MHRSGRHFRAQPRERRRYVERVSHIRARARVRLDAVVQGGTLVRDFRPCRVVTLRGTLDEDGWGLVAGFRPRRTVPSGPAGGNRMSLDLAGSRALDICCRDGRLAEERLGCRLFGVCTEKQRARPNRTRKTQA